MIKHKFLTNWFVILFMIIFSITTIKAQSSCSIFIPKPATFVSANKAAIVGNMSYVLDGEGTTGLPSSNYGNYGVYWYQSSNPVTFHFDMKTSSTISRVKFYGPWGFDEGAKNVTVRLYNGATLLGTEPIVLPSMYSSGYVAVLSKTYTDVTKIQMVIVDDYNISSASPKRTSLTEVVFGDTTCTDTDSDAVADYLDLDNDNDGIKDIDENCSGFLAQNTSGTWKGKTTSNLTATLTGASAQTGTGTNFDLNDVQTHYFINQNGADPRYAKSSNINFTYSFNTPVPAKEIAFYINDLDMTLGSGSAVINFTVNGGHPNGNFISTNFGAYNYLTFDNITGKITPTGTNVNDQNLLIKGIGDVLVSSITITSTGISVNDLVAYSLFANVPCDTDGDGIPNIFDLDSDNDGCPDAIEGGGNFNSSNLVNSSMPGGNTGATSGTYNSPIIQNLGNNVGSTTTTLGIPTIAGMGQSSGYSNNADIKLCTDSDGDGVVDLCDLDDDNDGILDVNENKCGSSGTTPNVRIGYIPNSRDLDTDKGYTFDGGYMSGSGALKLTNTANFGPTGIVNANITLVPITANPITKADITALNLNAIFLGGIDNSTTSYLANSELDAIKDWTDDSASNFVVVTQVQSKAWGSTITSGNINPDVPTSFGLSTPIFNGPFGNITSFNQGGGFQAYFATLNGACSTKKLAVDNSGRTVMYMDGVYNDLIIADVDILTTLGGVTSGSAITSNSDKLFGNIWAFVVSQSTCSDVDTDGDGIPNRLDLDSDGDGCPDAIEGAGNFTSSQLSTASGSINTQSQNQNFGTVVDANGIPTIVGASGQAIGESQDVSKNDCVDYDGDGYPDWQDLDDDNDGILDTVENCIDTTPLTLDKNNISGISTFSIVGGDNDVTPVTVGYAYWIGQNSQDESIQYTFTNPVYAIQIPQTINVNGNSTTNSELLEVYINGTLYPITASMVTGLSANSFISSGGSIGSTTMLAVTNFTAINIDYPAGIKNIRIRNNPSTVGGNGWEMNGLKILSRSTCNADLDGDGILNSLDLDSDNDGCPDAIEGGASFTNSNLVNSSMPGGNSDATSGTYNKPIIQNLGNTVGNTTTTMGVPTIAGTGQTTGDSQNSSLNNQCNFPCYKPAQTTGTTLDTNHGITALGRAGTDNSNWPMVRKGAWTVLEAKTKGFVVNRLTDAQISAIPATQLVEGMMVYNISQDCLQINVDGTATGWKCFNNQACPD